MLSFLYGSTAGAWIYYGACVVLWLLLAVLWAGAMRAGFPAWLSAHPRLQIALLGTNRMPANPGRTLKRFYSYLAGGWTWILVWSWWLGPVIKQHFFHNITSTKAYEMARISTMIVVIAYAATGFFAIGKSISIWFKEIYSVSPKS